MGFSLADIGLAGQGYNQAEQQRLQMQWGQEDHDWQAQQRKQLLDQQQRELAYQKELRDTMSQYLAGGSQSQMPMPAGIKTVQNEGLDTPEGDEPSNTPATVAKPAKPAADNMPGLYKAMASVQAKYGKAGEFEDTRKRLKKFQDEGVLDFIAKAKQGAPDDELLDTFNKSGAVKLADLKRTGDGTYLGTTADGQPVGLDVKAMTESLLSPKDLLSHQDKGDVTAERLKAVQTRTDAAKAIQDAKDKAQEDVRAARAEAATSKAAFDNARAQGAIPTGRGAARTAGNWNQYDSQVKSFANGYATSKDPDTLKEVVDRKAALELSSMASQLGRANPEMSPAEAVDAAKEKIDEIRQLRSEAQDQAETEAKTIQFDTPKKRDAWVASRAKGLSTMRGGSTRPVTGAAQAAPSAAAQPSGDESDGLAGAGAAGAPAKYPDAKQAPDGKWYVKRGNSFYMVKD